MMICAVLVTPWPDSSPSEKQRNSHRRSPYTLGHHLPTDGEQIGENIELFVPVKTHTHVKPGHP